MLAACASLGGCGTVGPPPLREVSFPEARPPGIGADSSVAALPGWVGEDHIAALQAFEVDCNAGRRPDLRALCAAAATIPVADDSQARRFLESNFRARWLGGGGVLTAYFAPEYPARTAPDDTFSAPVRQRPEDLVTLDLGRFDPALAGRKISGRVAGGSFVPYDDRGMIESAPALTPIAWMRPEDLFFLQIQGSGTLVMADGRGVKLAYAASNGRPFVGIASILRDRGLLADSDTSGEAIRRWLADHRGPEADAMMRQDPRYVFFKALPDDREPAGAAGVPLVPGRAVAVDPAFHAMGALLWIDAESPALAGAKASYQRMVVALDSGGAIKGAVRADLYMGSGAAAGAEAGRVRHTLNLYELVPMGQATP